jgi:AcrR family transcriptional regulator
VERPSAEARPLRADAERNRRALLDAARACFAEQGTDVSVAEIARRAGVGHGTVFRRFPTKERLIVEIVLDRMDELIATARESLAASPGFEAVLGFMRDVVGTQIQDRALAEAVGSSFREDPDLQDKQAELLGVVDELVRSAQRAGELRRDVSAVDVHLLTTAVVAAATPLCAATPDAWHRYLDLVAGSLRPGAATHAKLPGQPPTAEQLQH